MNGDAGVAQQLRVGQLHRHRVADLDDDAADHDVADAQARPLADGGVRSVLTASLMRSR
jgi:hypothetical protein